jgi:anti-anti-sigma factor
MSRHTRTLPGRFDAAFLQRFRSEWLQLSESRTGVVLDATAIQSFDINAFGCMLQLTQTLNQKELNLVVQNPPMSLVRCLQQSKIPKSLHTRYNQGAAEDLARSRVSHSLDSGDASGEAIVWKGNVTAQTVDRIWDETMSKIKQKEQKSQSFQIDLSHVTLLDSTGIGVMIKLKKRMVKQGYRLAFVNPKQNVQKILKMTQLSDYLLKG